MEKNLHKYEKIINLGKIVLDSVFPRHCPVCEEIVDTDSEFICRKCMPKLSFVREPVCMRCGKEISADTQELCADCMIRPKSFIFGRALLNYDDLAERAMIGIKYKNKREYIEGFAKLLAVRYEKMLVSLALDAILPIPVHEKRRRERGYNQAEILAYFLSRETGIAMFGNLLKRRKNTLAQKELNPEQRLKNLSDAFYAEDIPESLGSVLLVDDIYTTGSTMEACTRVLLDQGVKKVYCLSICIGKGES